MRCLFHLASNIFKPIRRTLFRWPRHGAVVPVGQLGRIDPWSACAQTLPKKSPGFLLLVTRTLVAAPGLTTSNKDALSSSRPYY